MSELKSFIVLYGGKFIRAYEESEADKVIADLEESHKKEVYQLLMEIVKLRAYYMEACGRLLCDRINSPPRESLDVDVAERIRESLDRTK